jgi:hypothetical protein
MLKIRLQRSVSKCFYPDSMHYPAMCYSAVAMREHSLFLCQISHSIALGRIPAANYSVSLECQKSEAGDSNIMSLSTEKNNHISV